MHYVGRLKLSQTRVGALSDSESRIRLAKHDGLSVAIGQGVDKTTCCVAATILTEAFLETRLQEMTCILLQGSQVIGEFPMMSAKVSPKNRETLEIPIKMR